MFTLPGSLTIFVLSLIGCVTSFAIGPAWLGMVFLPVIIIFGLAAFLKWADMTNI